MGQTAFNGIVTGMIIGLPALAVTLLFGILKFPNFAVGAMMTLGAYLAFTLNVLLGWPLSVAAAAAAAALGVICIAIDRVTFRPLRDRGGVTLMVASLGVAFILENLTRLAYGNATRSFAIELARPLRFMGIRMNEEQLMAIAIAALTMVAMYLLLTRTSLGRAMRAIADNASIAQVRGIDTRRMIRWTWFIAGVLIAISGVLVAMDRSLEPPMGTNYIIIVFAAAILGGLGSPAGALLGALCIGLVSELSTLVLSPAYRMGVPLCVIALVLLLRPQGLFGLAQIKK
jgi:branched-subunit amino acid ABC-type transport system permease component